MAFFDKLVANEAYLSKLFCEASLYQLSQQHHYRPDRITSGNLKCNKRSDENRFK